jgi:flagellar basal body L-ring protein FlgH
MHSQFDRSDSNKEGYNKDKFQQYRKKKDQGHNSISSLRNPYVVPSVKREYKSESSAKKRYKAHDLEDNRGDGSLWSGVEGRSNFLFTNNEHKINGDIILIQVADKLKHQITSELKRAFPTAPAAPKKAGGKTPASATPAPAPKTADAKKEDGDEQTVHDRISSVVIEEVNKDHIIIRGRKNVIYKNRKRLVEVQALIAQRDIQTNDTVSSDQIIETNINILR